MLTSPFNLFASKRNTPGSNTFKPALENLEARLVPAGTWLENLLHPPVVSTTVTTTTVSTTWFTEAQIRAQLPAGASTTCVRPTVDKVTVRSTVGDPNATSKTLGGSQFRQHQPQPPVPTHVSTHQQPAHVFYVYGRNSHELPWICIGGFCKEAQAKQKVIWVRQHGGEAYFR